MPDLATLVTEWAVARREAITLRGERNAKECAEAEEHDYRGYCRWRIEGQGSEIPRERWCQPCRDRQDIHEAYRAAVKRRGVANLKLARFAERTLTAAAEGNPDA